MDPVSIFNALHDTKIIKFGRYELKSGLVAPYYINLRRLPLYPELMDAIVTQVVERFLTNQALSVTMCQLRQRSFKSSSSTTRKMAESIGRQLEKLRLKEERRANGLEDAKDEDEELDSQLGEEDASEICSSESEWETISHHDMDPIISGVPYGAVPIASAIAFKSKLPFLFQRKEVKGHGDHQPLMEDFNDETRNVFGTGRAHGRPDIGDEDVDDDVKVDRRQQVILIEDVICSGESILETVQELERQNLKVEFVICIIDREENGINLLLKNAGIQVLSLFKISAVLRVLEATERITSKQFISTRKWIDENQFRRIGVDPTQASATANQVASSESSNQLIGVATN